MVSRLVLGCAGIGQRIVDVLASRGDGLRVISDDRSRVETLRNENVRAHEADPTDPETLKSIAPTADTVVVAGRDPGYNRAIATTARAVYPDALLIAYVAPGANETDRDAIEAIADRTIEPAAAVAEYVTDVVASQAGTKARRLRRTLRRIDGTLAVVMHDNPDPDAIASAITLARLSEIVGTPAEACYFGEISHQENRAFVNLLKLDLNNLDPGADLSGYGGFALVDHSRPGVNDQLPEDTPIDVIIDHHPPRGPVEARFIDLRSDAGATSTLATEYIERFDVAMSETIATALLYGIRVDTDDFTREVSEADFKAAATVLPHADTDTLARVESPSIDTDTFDTIGRAIRNREVRDAVLASSVGRLSDRDALAQAADKLLEMDGIATTLVYGYRDGTIYLSARARGADIDLGETLRQAFDRIGSAGGHADMAGAQIPMGVLGAVEDDQDEKLSTIVEDVVNDRFFEALSDRPRNLSNSLTPTGGFDYPLAGDADRS